MARYMSYYTFVTDGNCTAYLFGIARKLNNNNGFSLYAYMYIQRYRQNTKDTSEKSLLSRDRENNHIFIKEVLRLILIDPCKKLSRSEIVILSITY